MPTPRKEPDPDYLTTNELADLLRTSTETLRHWRVVGYGPKGVKVGRRVLYRRRDLEGWLRDQGFGAEP